MSLTYQGDKEHGWPSTEISSHNMSSRKMKIDEDISLKSERTPGGWSRGSGAVKRASVRNYTKISY